MKMLSALPSSAWFPDAVSPTSYTQAARTSAYNRNLLEGCFEEITMSLQEDADAVSENEHPLLVSRLGF